jgi:hypothetical protein
MNEPACFVLALFCMASIAWHAAFRKTERTERQRKADEESRAARRRARVRVEHEER